MINKVTLLGNLGADPELQDTKGKTEVCRLRVATTHGVKKKDGTWENETEWHSVVLFGKTAVNASQHLEKGRQVYIEGRLRTTKYKDKNEIERYQTQIIGDVIKYLGSSDKKVAKSDNVYEESHYSQENDDIPF